MARALGWFSVGLGLTELLAPRSLARAIGVKPDDTTLRALGLRELASGVGILTSGRPVWLKSRVLGDLMDLAMLGGAARSRGSDPAKLAVASTAVLGVLVLDVLASRNSTAAPAPVVHTIAINKPPDELHRFLRDASALAAVLQHVTSVNVIDGHRTRWTLTPLPRTTLHCEVEVTAEEPGRRLAWSTMEGSDLPHQGLVTLQPLPQGRGTLLKLELFPKRAQGARGRALAKVLGTLPTFRVDSDLRRIKQWLEVGEIATTQGQPTGTRSAISRLLP